MPFSSSSAPLDVDGLDGQAEPFVYIDDNGDTIAPEEETSWLMALGIQNHGGGGDEVTGGKPSCSSSSSVVEGADLEVPYFEDPLEFERERLLAEKRFEEVLQNNAATLSDTDDDDYDVDEENSPHTAADAASDAYDDEGATMGCRTFSREATHNDDEWILERILDRRVLRGSSSPTSTDFKVVYDDFGKKETVMMTSGRIEYLCKWKWYVEPSWEGKELLEDEGFARECRAYDETVATKKALNIANAKVAPLWSDLHPEYAVKVKRKKKTLKNNITYVEKVFGDLTSISAISGLDMDVQASIFKLQSLTLYNYGVCATDEQISAFMREFNSKRKTHRPVLLYHGSQIHNYASICQNGLRVPRSRGDVRNGKVHGMGIYAAYSPISSVGFCCSPVPRCRMLLCVALVSPTDSNVKMVPGYCAVFFNSSLILPIVALDVAIQPAPHVASLERERQIHSYETLGYLSPPKCAINIAAEEKRLRDLYGGDDVVVTAEEKARAMCRVRNKNILNINRLAEKTAAAAASSNPPKK